MTRFEDIWERIKQYQGEEFYQIRGQAFTYDVIGSVVVPSTTNQQLPKSHFEKAFEQVPLENTVGIQHLRGPSYIFAILMDKRIRQSDW